MASFGGFETVREIGTDALGVVYAARRSGAETPKGESPFVVKVRRPLARFDQATASGSGETTDGALKEFVAAVQAQKRLAEQTGPLGGWAPVHAYGPLREGGAFSVTDRASIGTALKLARGRVPIDGRELSAIIAGVATALRSAENAAGRGHGNLKPSNVLISGDHGLDQARVTLADPLSDERADAERDKRADLRAIGELIVLLVTHEPYRGGWPVAAGPEWERLGTPAGGWIELVNGLLDPSDQAQRPSLEELLSIVHGLKPKGSRRRTLVISGVAAMLVVAAVVAAFVLASRSERAKVDVTKRTIWTPATQAQYAAAWSKYCEEFNWFEPFKKRLAEPIKGAWAGGRKRAEIYAESGLDLEPVLKQIAEGHLEPYNIDGGDSGRSYKQRAEAGPTNERVVSDDGVNLTARGLELVGQVRAALTDTWTVRGRLAAAAADFQTRGWESAAKLLGSVAEALAPLPQRDMVGGVDLAMSTDRRLRPISEAWAGVEALGAKLSGLGDKVLAAYSAVIPRLVGEKLSGSSGAGVDAALDALGKSIGEAASLGEQLIAQSEPKKLDADSLWESEEYRSLAAKVELAQGRESPDVLREWLTLAKQFPPITDPDPRETWKASETLAALTEQADRLNRPPVPVRLEDADAALLASARADSSVLSALRWWKRNQAKIVAGDSALKEQAKRLTDAVRLKSETRADMIRKGKAAVIEALGAPTSFGPGLGLVEHVVDSWRAALRGGVTDDNFPDVRARFDQMDRAVRDAVGQFVSAEAGDQAGPKSAWKGELSKVVASKVERRLADAFRALPEPPEIDSLRRAAESATESQKSFAQAVRAIESELTKTESALNDGFVVNGDAPRAREASDALAAATKSAAWADVQVQAAITPLISRIDAGKAIGSKTNADELLGIIDAAKATAPEQVLAGVARLSALAPPWPGTRPQFERARALRQTAGVSIERVPDASRRTAATAEITAAVSHMWTAFASQAADADSMDAALDSTDEFGVPVDGIEPRFKYNLLLHRLRKDGIGPEAKPDAAVSASLKDFVSKATPVGGDRRLMARLTEIANDQEPPFDPAKVGPGLAGWTPQSLDNDRRLIYTPRATGHSGGATATSLGFIRLGESPKDSVYLGETEVSIGQFAGIITGAGGDWGVTATMISPAPDAAPDDSPPARVWRWKGNAIVPADAWIPDNAVVGQGKGQTIAMYPPGLNVEPPKPNHPMQSISPAAALYVARLVNCRFPTADEWRKAFELFVRQKPATAALRGQAFNAELDYLAGAVRQRGVNEVFLPWPDKGIFAQAGRNAQAVRGDTPSPVLWFGPVDSDGGTSPIHHLVGNVAEFVFPDKNRLESLPKQEKAIRALVDDAGAQIKAIGGSSLSPPGVAFNTEQELSDGPVDEGYTDVGFRLAFSASGRRSLYDQAREELDKAPYVFASR